MRPSPAPLTHAHVWYIKLPMYLLFIWCGTCGFEGGKSITRAILEGGPEMATSMSKCQVSVLYGRNWNRSITQLWDTSMFATL